MSSTLENFNDEILMIISKYFSNVITIIRAFIGLNHTLIDKRLHLLTDFLFTKIHDEYYT
jgi:hypothetical protein